MFQSPKGRLQTIISLMMLMHRKSFNPQRGGYKHDSDTRKANQSIVSIPKGEATNIKDKKRIINHKGGFNPQRGGYKRRRNSSRDYW